MMCTKLCKVVHNALRSLDFFFLRSWIKYGNDHASRLNASIGNVRCRYFLVPFEFPRNQQKCAIAFGCGSGAAASSMARCSCNRSHRSRRSRRCRCCLHCYRCRRSRCCSYLQMHLVYCCLVFSCVALFAVAFGWFMCTSVEDESKCNFSNHHNLHARCFSNEGAWRFRSRSCSLPLTLTLVAHSSSKRPNEQTNGERA